MKNLLCVLFSVLLFSQCSEPELENPLGLNGLYKGELIYTQSKVENPCGVNLVDDV